MHALAIERVEVGSSRVEAIVRVTDHAFMRTSAVPELAETARDLLPGLTRHRCENSDGRDLLRELSDTETPHLLEHVAAELMALAGSPRSLRAETVWDFARDGLGVFRLRIDFDDDLVAVGALREALPIADWLLGLSAEKPDVDVAVERLRAVRGLGGK